MKTSLQILRKYWKHDSFRPVQEEIINSVLEGKDTLALLPTGGGKSVCFQVPALVKEGICVVVSPLIALMKDQVDGLKSRGVKAISITSEMKKREIDITLDNCIYGDIKFLYLSPERLETEIVKVRLQKMNVNLIAVDEAHCISQWGYDFRPSYLKIALLREVLPKVPILALTATATPRVVKDIQKQLLFSKSNLFSKSFERKNLSYIVLHEADKLARIEKILKKVKGSGIIYVRNRKKAQDIAQYLHSQNVSADYYHAGLEASIRTKKQSAWMNNECRIIVCTNAFGMGIDKSDVSVVIHADIPESIESYFQEAGRAGRNGEKAYAILLHSKTGILELERNLEKSFPSLDTIRKVYQSLANYYQIAIGSGAGTTFSFDMSAFCNTYNLETLDVFYSLKFIQREGYITLSDAFFQASKVKVELSREDIYHFQLSSPQHERFIKVLLRSTTGIFDNFVKINEFELAKSLSTSKENITKQLFYFEKQKVLTYIPQTELPQLTFELERVDAKRLTLSKEYYSTLKKLAIERTKAIIDYTSSTYKCRSQILLSYFGDTDAKRCGQCDVCLHEEKTSLSTDMYEAISAEMKLYLETPATLQALVDSLSEGSESQRIKTVQWLLDNEELFYNAENLLCLKLK